MDYCTIAEVKQDIPDSALSSTLYTEYDGALGAMISAASRLIDNEVGRWPGYFYPTTDLETRYFDSQDGEAQDIDEVAALTSVSVLEDGSTWTAWTLDTDFYTWPYNASGIGQPIRRIVIDYLIGGKSTWTRYRKAIKVVGRFGYSLVPPDDIKQACKIQAFRWFMRAKQGYQDASASASMGQMIYVQQLDPDIKTILQHYQIENMV